MSDRLKDKACVVTGAGSGIGRATAIRFAEEGAKVLCVDINSQAVSTTVEEIQKSGGIAEPFAADISVAEQTNRFINSCVDRYGSIDVLVNNAGIQFVSPIEEFPIEKWDAIIAINLSSAFHTIRAALPGMKDRGFGRIINVASAHGLVASPFKSAYVAAKHGIVGLTKTIALEAAQHGVTVNAVCPGYVLTPLVEGQIPDTAKARGITEEEVKRDVLLAAQPTKEFVTTEQLGALCVFLASDAAASITGTSLPVDGGWTAQ